ncbi:hypothetical protein [uncultured Aeromicrobium sp.]|uniref:hypothetical protein n=1 Tax=uncultured Aeromicrobium sp. TaxID=337820 RepID=UPI0025FC7E98|nr:hypothetical protein [uncultured Aeromicrobium sp.]
MSQLLDDLDVIGHLDYEPPCEPSRSGCDKPATWRITAHHRCCGHAYDGLACTEHKQVVVEAFTDSSIRPTLCGDCGALALSVAGLIQIDTVEPLRGGERQ